MTADESLTPSRQVSDLAMERFDLDAEFHARVYTVVQTMLRDGEDGEYSSSLVRTVAIAAYIYDRYEAIVDAKDQP